MPFNKYTNAKIEDVKIESEVTAAVEAEEAAAAETSTGDSDTGTEGAGEATETSLD